ncbi:MAG: tetratricopeptide repeat protein [Pseudomonadota bacterium]
MNSLLRKMFGSAAGQPAPALPERDVARCAELTKRGNALLAQGMLGESERAYRAATQADPQNAGALVNLGYVLGQQNKWVEAGAALKQALLRDPDQYDAHFMLGKLAFDKANIVEATAHMREVLRIQPGFDLTTYFSAEDSTSEALAICRMVLSIDPDNALAHRSVGMTSLRLGDFRTGWKEYEWRFRIDVKGQTHKTFPQPLWLGDAPVDGKTVLLHWEQGYGDTLQFCRYAREVKAQGASVLLQVQPGLGSLLACLDGVDILLEENEPVPPFDLHCPLMSLPLALGEYSGSFASGTQPYLHAPEGRIDYWQRRLEEIELPARPRTGIVWSGNPAHVADLKRSIPLGMFLHVLPADFRVVALQPLVRPADMAILDQESRVTYLGAELSTFAETAALISALDLVITVDTGVAHLAGAMGKTVWVLLPYMSDWRWLMDREDSPWYPHMRLFRQQVVDDWNHPLEAVRLALADRIQSGA